MSLVYRLLTGYVVATAEGRRANRGGESVNDPASLCIGARGDRVAARVVAAVVLGVVEVLAAFCAARAWADAGWGDPVQPRPLPIFSPTPSNWQPQFPFPFDQTSDEVTGAEIDAEREMCQWFNAQYSDLKLQIERLNDTIIRNNGQFNADGVAPQVDIVAANIDQSVNFLTPRVQTLTQSANHSGDVYFPLYQGDSFYGLWQQLSNVANGLRAAQPTWFTGPSFLRAQHWGSKIHRSQVCG
jgi:hypothetical protein